MAAARCRQPRCCAVRPLVIPAIASAAPSASVPRYSRPVKSWKRPNDLLGQPTALADMRNRQREVPLIERTVERSASPSFARFIWAICCFPSRPYARYAQGSPSRDHLIGLPWARWFVRRFTDISTSSSNSKAIRASWRWTTSRRCPIQPSLRCAKTVRSRHSAAWQRRDQRPLRQGDPLPQQRSPPVSMGERPAFLTYAPIQRRVRSVERPGIGAGTWLSRYRHGFELPMLPEDQEEADRLLRRCRSSGRSSAFTPERAVPHVAGQPSASPPWPTRWLESMAPDPVDRQRERAGPGGRRCRRRCALPPSIWPERRRSAAWQH